MVDANRGPARTPLLSALMVIATLAVAAMPAAVADTRTWPDPVDTAAEIMPGASRALLLDVLALDDGRLVAVGERGHILLSDDNGGAWRQVPVPSRSTLTAVAAGNGDLAAVGHDGVVLHSGDRGETWQRVREERHSPDNFDSLSNGAPLLDVLFLDDRRVLAIGAYSLMLASDDGGRSWQPRSLELTGADDVDAADHEDGGAGAVDDDDGGGDWSDPVLFSDEDLLLGDEADPHLNAIARLDDGRLLIVGERGSAWRSDDEGATWARLRLPYGGSMYGVLPLSGAHLLAYGLRGRVFESGDGGDTWSELDSDVQVTLFDGAVAADGGIVLAGGQGIVLRRAPAADRFTAAVYVADNGETPALAGLRALPDGRLLLVGERGVTVWEARP